MLCKKKNFFIITLLLSSVFFSVEANENVQLLESKKYPLELTKQEQNWLRTHPSITIALDDQNPPMNFRDTKGSFSGISIDYLNLISKKIGIKINFWGGSWDEALGKAINHTVDGILNAAIRDSRKPYLNFTNSYFETPTAFVTKKGFPTVEWIHDFDEKTIAVVAGTARVSIVKSNCPKSKILIVKSPMEGLKKLSEGKVDAFFDDLPVIQFTIEKNFLSNLKVSLLYYSEIGKSRIGLSNEKPELTSIFNKGIAAISPTEHQIIWKKWFHLTEKSAIQHNLQLTQEERDWLISNPTITVAADPEWAPIEYLDKDHQYKGIAMDYLKEIETHLNIKFKFVHGTWQELLEKGKKGEIDIFSSLSKTEERENYFSFTAPYISLPVVVFGHKEGRYMTNLEDIADHQIGVVKNYATHAWVKKDYPNFKLKPTKNISEALEKLRKGEIDYFIGNIISTGFYIQTENYPDIKVVGDTPYSFDNRIGIQKNIPQLIGILNKAIKSISESKRREIYNNWIKVEYQRGVDYSFFYKLIIGAAVIFALILLWNYHLSKIVGKRTAELTLSNNALTQSEHRFRSLYENIPIGLFRAKIDGTIISLNPAIVQMFGYDNKSDMLKKSAFDLYTNPDDRNKIISSLSETKLDVISELKFRKKDKTTFWGSLNIRLQKNGTEHTSYLDGTITDITMRKKAERTLKESEQRYRTLFNTANDSIFLLLENEIVDCNAKALEMFACSSEIIQSKQMYQIHPQFCSDEKYSKSQFEKKVKDALNGKAQFFEWKYWRGNESSFDAEVTLTKMDVSTSSYILSIVRDIAQRKKTEIEKNKLMEKLNQSQKMEAIGTLAGGIAHDFNNILTAILGYTDLAQDSVSPSSDLGADLAEIKNAGERAQALVKQILAFSHQSKQAMQPTQIHVVIKEALKLLRSSIPTTIEIKENIDIQSGAVLSDATQIHQVIMNLGTNAYHAMREKGGVLGVTLRTVHIEKDDHKLKNFSLTPGHYIELEVSDTGIGMTKENIKKIFNPYFTTKPKGEGTGMGLSVVHGIIKSYGGHISVYSELGKGSTFRIYLPRTNQNKAINTSIALNNYPLGAGHALIVDDEEVIVKMLSRVLTSLGYTVEAKTNSNDALETFTIQPDNFDFIITDMTMPDLSGVQLIQRIRNIRSDIPIILCTGFSELVDREKALQLGVDKFLMKPVIKRDVAEAVREVLKKNKA